MMLSFIYRFYAFFISGSEAPKTNEPLRFGVLGASFIAYVGFGVSKPIGAR